MKRFTFMSLMLSLLTSSSCSQMLFQRSYLAEMEHDDSRFFNPHDDFPVVAGDSGRSWATEHERRKRTPASVEELENDRYQASLKHELRTLENSQSEEALNLYQKHKHRLATTSERIYYLQLPHSERIDYLRARGMLEEDRASTPVAAQEHMWGVRNSDISLGMSKDDVRQSWGKPSRVEIAGNPSFENERWLYSVNGAPKYIYFESGVVQGWE